MGLPGPGTVRDAAAELARRHAVAGSDQERGVLAEIVGPISGNGCVS